LTCTNYFSVLITVHNSVHNTSHSSFNNLPPYPPDNHRCSDTVYKPVQVQCRQMVTLQIIHGHAGLTHHFKFFDIQALWRYVLSARISTN